MVKVRELGVRHVQILFAFFYLIVGFIARVDISIAILSITDKTKRTSMTRDWSEVEKGIVLSSFFVGYIATQIPGGKLAEMYGPRPVMLYSMVSNGFFAFLTYPAIYYCGPLVVSVVRFFIGLSQGPFFPSLNTFLIAWIPPRERTMLYPPTFSGIEIGTLIGMFLGGFLSSTSMGWPSVFCTTAILSFTWCGFWFFFGSSSPDDFASITVIEKVYIEEKQMTDYYVPTRKELSIFTPWKDILTSRPVWATIVAHCGHNWCYSILLTQLPSYMTNILGMSVAVNGLVSAILHLIGAILILTFALISYKISMKKTVSIDHQRKCWTCIDLWGMGSGMILLVLTSTRNAVISLPLLCLAIGSTCASYTGFISGITDISPNYSGTLMGLSNTVASTAMLLAPIFVSSVVTDLKSIKQWNTVFIVNTFILILAGCIYITYFQAAEQPWNVPKILRRPRFLKKPAIEDLEDDTDDDEDEDEEDADMKMPNESETVQRPTSSTTKMVKPPATSGQSSNANNNNAISKIPTNFPANTTNSTDDAATKTNIDVNPPSMETAEPSSRNLIANPDTVAPRTNLLANFLNRIFFFNHSDPDYPVVVV